MIVERLEARDAGVAVERAATFRWGDGEARARLVVPAELAGDPEDASPFLPLALLPAMQLGEDLVVDGPVSPRLLRGAQRARELYHAWCPPLRESTIEVAEERECVPRSSEIGCFLSRGVDSTYSAARPRTYPGPLSRLVFITGFEPNHSAEVAAEEMRRARTVAERIGLPLNVVEADFVLAVTPAVGNLDDITSPMLALVALSLSGGLGTVIVPPTDNTLTLGPHGTSPVLDPLFSTEAVALEHDSVAFGRVDKGLWIARERPDLLAELKVCFKVNRPDNCGECLKCLMTMCTLRAVDALEAAHQFPNEVDVEAVRAARIATVPVRLEWARLAQVLGEQGDDELQEAIVEALDRPGVPYPGPPPREDTPDFRQRHSALVTAVTRDGRAWPPAEAFAAPPGLGLVRAVDAEAGRHVYGVGLVPEGELAGELGSLPRTAATGLEPLWVTAGGYLVTGDARGAARGRRGGAARWSLAPLAWRDSGEPAGARARAALARAATAVRGRGGRSSAHVAVVAHLHRHHQPGRLPLFSALHPVTGDQLLTTSEWEAADMGYGEHELLGYVDALAPVTGTLERARPRVPWASRFGQRLRSA